MGAFFNQPSKPYRDMQIVFALLTLNFIIPSLGYFFAPKLALEQFLEIGRVVGAGDYGISEQSNLWRVLAAGNVFTLGILTFWMGRNIRTWPTLGPAFFVLKGFSSLGYLYVYFVVQHYFTWVIVFFWDGLAGWAVWWFGRRALRDIGATPSDLDRTLVPHPSQFGSFVDTPKKRV